MESNWKRISELKFVSGWIHILKFDSGSWNRDFKWFRHPAGILYGTEIFENVDSEFRIVLRGIGISENFGIGIRDWKMLGIPGSGSRSRRDSSSGIRNFGIGIARDWDLRDRDFNNFRDRDWKMLGIPGSGSRSRATLIQNSEPIFFSKNRNSGKTQHYFGVRIFILPSRNSGDN
jgi:hypothetical protein